MVSPHSAFSGVKYSATEVAMYQTAFLALENSTFDRLTRLISLSEGVGHDYGPQNSGEGDSEV